MKATKRHLIGRTIVAVDMRPFHKSKNQGGDSRNGMAHDPVLTLDNGRRIFFVVDETELGDYGVTICITEAGGPC